MKTPAGRLRQPEFDEEPLAEAIDWRHYLWAVYRRRRVVATVFVTIVLLVAWRTLTATPIYEASAQLLIETRERNVLAFKDVVDQDRTALEFSLTQHRLLRSRALARQTLDALKLWEHPQFGGLSKKPSDRAFSLPGAIAAPLTGASRSLRSAPANEHGDAGESNRQSGAIDAFLGSLYHFADSQQPARRRQFRSPDAVLAAKAANELMRQYIAQNQELKLQGVQRSLDVAGAATRGAAETCRSERVGIAALS